MSEDTGWISIIMGYVRAYVQGLYRFWLSILTESLPINMCINDACNFIFIHQ